MVSSVGPYKVLDQLGAGGMGEVCLAEDPRLRRLVALKRLTGERLANADARAGILREARAVAQLQHSGIATVFDVIEDADEAWIVMEYVRGETLAARLRRGRIPLSDAVDFGSQMADALAAAHAQGVLHCDLKPSNVLVTPEGKTKLLDFGLARGTTTSSSTEETREASEVTTAPSRLAGSPGYLAPERLSGAPMDERGDIYSLGVILYEMATGRRPFAGTDMISIAASALTSAPVAPSAVDPAIPEPVSDVILKALASNPAMRFQTAADLAKGWKSGMAGKSMVTARPQRAKRLLLPAALLAITATLATFGVRQYWQSREGGTSNLEARADYLQGQEFLAHRDAAGAIDNAIEAFKRALAKDPAFALAYAGLGAAYWEKYRDTRDTQWLTPALDASLQAMRQIPGRAEVHITLGRIYSGLNRRKDAEQELRRALQIQPNSDDAHRLLAEVNAAEGKTAEALAEFRKAIAIQPDDWENRYSLGRFLGDQGRLADARGEFRRVTELQPNNAKAFNALGVTEMNLDHVDLAIASFARAIEILGGKAGSPYSNLGTAYFWKGDFQQARLFYEKAVPQAPADAQLYRNLGDALAASGDMEGARATYGKALDLAKTQLKGDSENFLTLSLAAVLEAKLGRYSEARSRIAAAYARRPKDSPDSKVPYRDAAIYALSHDPDQALAVLKQAIKNGYSTVEAAHDPDLQILRDRPQFAELVRMKSQ